MAGKNIRLLIVDDSVVVRGMLTKLLGRDPSIEVVGSASDPYEAREKIFELKPDVITLDVEMPKMDGLTFLKKLMAHHPMPVVMVSSLTRDRADLTVKAIELGAVDVVAKPSSTEGVGLAEIAIDLVDKIKAASRARVRRLRTGPAGMKNVLGQEIKTAGAIDTSRVRGTSYARAGVLTAPPELKRNQHKIIVIGASTGGTEALRVVLEALPRETPPILVVQHMPAYFTYAFANRLDSLCTIDVKEAADGDELRSGRALIAAGDNHLMIRRIGVQLRAGVRTGPLVCRHRPSVEVLFQSAAKLCGPNTVGVMLTGMGNDGANAMALMKAAGAVNIAQDEASSIVYGMPKEAVKCGGVDRVEHLERIPQAILDLCCK